MIRYILGTTMSYNEDNVSAFSLIRPLIQATGGFTLSQIKALTGLEGSTIQNWVKRGWVPKPEGKKYNEGQLSRILIISALKDGMRIEQIIRLIEYAKLPTPDGEEVLQETVLFDYLCECIRKLNPGEGISEEQISRCVNRATAGYRPPTPTSVERLHQALTVMVMAYLSSSIQRRAEELFQQTIS